MKTFSFSEDPVSSIEQHVDGGYIRGKSTARVEPGINTLVTTMARGDQLARQWKIIQALIASRRGKSVRSWRDGGMPHRTVYRIYQRCSSRDFR